MSTYITTTLIGNIQPYSAVNPLNDNQFIHVDTGTIIDKSLVAQINPMTNESVSTLATVSATDTEYNTLTSEVLNSIDSYLVDSFVAYDSYTLNDDKFTFFGTTSLFKNIEIKVGESYRAYSITTNRWDLFTFEKTAADIGRILSGFALKCPSSNKSKKKRLIALNLMYKLNLTKEQILQSVNN